MDTATILTKRVDTAALEQKVKAMYRDVALAPQGEFHFEMGRALAERLGYASANLDAIPRPAIDSFAGVGYYFDLAHLKPGEAVVDFGSGSGMDSFIAAGKVGKTGTVIRRRHDRRAARQSGAPACRGGIRQRHLPQGLHRRDRTC